MENRKLGNRKVANWKSENRKLEIGKLKIGNWIAFIPTVAYYYSIGVIEEGEEGWGSRPREHSGGAGDDLIYFNMMYVSM